MTRPMDHPLVPIFTPRSGADLAIVSCLLDAYGFPHFVHNNHFGSLYPGPIFDLYNQRRVCVPDRLAAEARQLIVDFLPDLEFRPYNMSAADKLRVIAEAIFLGGWFVPGSKWPRSPA